MAYPARRSLLGGLSAHELRNVPEVLVARDEDEIVLQCLSGDPEIVIRHWRASALELNKQARIMFRGFSAGQ